MRFDAIIFDFDGTIVDSEVTANTLLAEQLTSLGLPTTLDEALDDYCGHSWHYCAGLIEERLGRTLPEGFLDRFYYTARDRHLREMRLIAGAEDFIAAHPHRGRAIASSNDREWLTGCLDRLGIASHFGGHVYSAADLPRGKPHPDVYLHAADAVGASPSRALAIEDTPIGAQSAVDAGMTVVGLLAGGHVRDGHGERLSEAGAHHLVADYAELAALLADLER